MLSLPSPQVCLKRKPCASIPLGSRKRARLVGIFEPRCLVPTGARRSWTFAKEPRFTFGSVTQGSKRFLEEDEDMSTNINCKIRVLDNRDILFLPSCKRLSTPGKPQRKRTPSSSPAKKSVEFVRLRRREFLRQRQLQREDSGICMESDDDLDLDILFEPMTTGEDIKLFGGVDASTFTGFSVEMMEAMETATEDDMEIEDVSISTTTTSTSTTQGDVADFDSATEQTSSKDEDKTVEPESDMPAYKEEEDDDEEEEEKESSDVEVEDAGKKTTEKKKEGNTVPSTKDTAIKEPIRKRLGVDDLVRLGPPNSKRGVIKKVDEDEEEDEEPPRRSTRRKSTKPSLPTTVEEDEDDERERDDDDDVVVVTVKRRSSRTSRSKEDEKRNKGKDDGSDEEIEKKEGKKEKKKLVRRKVKVEESESEADESEREDARKPKRKVAKPEEKVEEEELAGDKMEEDTDEDANSSGEDTDMSTDEDITEAITEDKVVIGDAIREAEAEEDVTMSEDDEMTEESPRKEIEEDIDADAPAKDTQEVNVEPTSEDTEFQEEKLQTTVAIVAVEAKKSVRRLVLAPSKKDELEVAKLLSVPRTPRTPRSPNMSRFNITMSKAPRKLNPLTNPLMSPRRGKFNRSEELSAHWAMRRLAAKKRQQPFNPANISRHAYRDPINEDELYNHAARRALLDDDEAEEAYADEHFLKVEWTCTTKSWDGRYSAWMMENGSALMEFCVRKLEGFNMGW